jgi:hypothetical protein
LSFYESYQQTVFFQFPELTAPGVTDAVDVYVVNYLSTRNYTLAVTVTNINKSLVVRLDGSIDGVNFAPLISNTITENGHYIFNSSGSPVKKIRANFLEEAGGTDVVVQFDIAAN